MPRYTTPYDYWRWRQDAASVSIEKESPTSYRLDLSAARYAQRIVFNPRRELPTVTVVAPR